eukprot:gnl/MRDRNA2_/MRDRNA2_100923_c0_seq1.p1 gnl/MRDRNA2_/MRDRNA2_100923_c0~~gnl/MRDRNA2_/MRDRNA2_100923_c0_seq1.p1  ORF type:complete len:838 (-),score=219.69 gnl/MRDRNA2_/MRDRNA2_100923_c0_seq1:235-2748(-)
MAEPDYYDILGVARTATLHEIRSKFRTKVLAEHPDKGGDPKKFQLLNKAYNILTDREKRQRYDATGRADKSAEEEFIEGFGGGRLHFEPRSKQADEKAVVNLQDRIVSGPQTHDDGFQEWLRQRDQSEMVLTDKDFMKTALFNAAELAVKISHTSPVLHCLGAPKTDSYGQALEGAVQVSVKRMPLKKTLDHDEILVRMLAVPVDDSMVYAELTKPGVCLGMSGVGRIEQLGSRVEELRQEDAILIMPKPTKFSASRPIGTARTLLVCNEEDVLKIPSEVLEELTPEQICLGPSIVCAYILLESFGAKLKPGDAVLLNAAHISAVGSALLQLCKLLKLKPLCILSLPGAPVNTVKGEYGAKAAWQDADARTVAPPSVRAQYERISEWLVTCGAEEVFPDSVALLRWRDRNQRMLPKLGLDGIANKDSTEQLLHCLAPGDKDATLVVYGHGKAAPISVSPPLLSGWGGNIQGFNIARWVHALSANTKKMMSVLENVTKLIRANKFVIDTTLFKMGSDSIADAFSKAADAADGTQVVLMFPTLSEESQKSESEIRFEEEKKQKQIEEERRSKAEEDERNKLRDEWLDLLFTDQSVAAMSPEGPIPVEFEAGNTRNPSSILVWIGDNKGDAGLIRDLPMTVGSAAVLSLDWTTHPSGEALEEVSLTDPSVADGSWYLREKRAFENSDLDLLHDIELLGRSLISAVEPKLLAYKLDWKQVVVLGFGKGAGVALYAALMGLFPKQLASMVLFNTVMPFPTFLGQKLDAPARRKEQRPNLKIFTIWGNRDRTTPGTYRQLLAQTLKKAPEVHCTPDTLPDGEHEFSEGSFGVLTSLLPLCLPR